jgi:glycosyltransferase involved in cell wall biosynthesis
MRILHFLLGRCNPDSPNGVDKTVYFLSKAQAALGNRVGVFSLTPKPPIFIPGVLVKTYQPSRISFRLPNSLLRELLKWQPDVVHLHSVYSPPNTVLSRWLHKQGIPYVKTPHGGLSRYVLRRRWYLKVPYRSLFELPTLNHALFIHAVDDAEDIRNYGVRKPIVTTPNGLDLTVIPTNLNKESLNSHFPQLRGKRVFLFLGRLDPLHKGLDLLFEGFALAQVEDTVLVLVGPDWRGGKKTLEALARKLSVASRVVFAGPVYQKKKFDFLAGTDVFVHSSRWEGVAFSVLEAAAVGKPCLVTHAADPCGMLERYQAGIIVEPQGAKIAQGIRQLAAKSADELQAMGARARQMVGVEFSWERIAKVLTEAYVTPPSMLDNSG